MSDKPYDQARVVLDATEEDLVRMIAGSGAGSRLEAIKAEITLRNMRWQKEAATYAKSNARWMFWSVVVVLLTSLANLAWQIWSPACR